MGKITESKLSILVVDDDENILLVLRQSLEKEGFHVNTAKSAAWKEVVERSPKHGPALKKLFTK